MDLGVRLNKRKRRQIEPRNEPIKLNNINSQENTLSLAIQQFLQFKKDGRSDSGHKTLRGGDLLQST